MRLLALLFSVVVLSSISAAHAQEEPIILEKTVQSDERSILVKLEWPEVYPDEFYTFNISFHNPKTGKLLDDLRINYNVMVTQHDHEVEYYKYNLTRDGTGHFEVLFPEESQGPAKVLVEVRASSNTAGNTVWHNETVEFDVMVVPEFGVIAAMVLAASLVPILLLSKSRLQLRY